MIEKLKYLGKLYKKIQSQFWDFFLTSRTKRRSRKLTEGKALNFHVKESWKYRVFQSSWPFWNAKFQVKNLVLTTQKVLKFTMENNLVWKFFEIFWPKILHFKRVKMSETPCTTNIHVSGQQQNCLSSDLVCTLAPKSTLSL